MIKKIITRDDISLEAKITVPKGENIKNGAIIIVGGSDRIDLDGNIGSIKLRTYEYLANYLCDMGYYTIRFNKRGIGNSSGSFYETGVTDLIEDIDAVYNFLLDGFEYELKKIYLLGHSEGSILATIYSSINKNLSGLILLSGACLDLRTAQLRQFSFAAEELKNLDGIMGKLIRTFYKSDKLVENQKSLYETVLSSSKKSIKYKRKMIQAKWLREHLSYNKTTIKNYLAKANMPIFASFGSKDIQSTSEDMDELNAMKLNNITVKQIENLDHMLRDYKYSPTVVNQQKQYKYDSTLPLSESLLNELHKWLDTNTCLEERI